jgi:imidazolonepropionase-like amidohydrolase
MSARGAGLTTVLAGTLIDGSGHDPRHHVQITITGDTITSITDGHDVPAGSSVFDARHLTVMPGLIDSHVHLAMVPKGLEDRLQTPYSLQVAETLVNARLTLEAGVTTVRDAGGMPRGTKLAIERGMFPGPRARISVGALSQTGGHGDSTTRSGVRLRADSADAPMSEHPWTVADGVDEVRKGVRELIRAGADQIKMMTSGGVMSPGSEPGRPGFSIDEITAIVNEARAAGRTTMSHAQASVGIMNAVKCGVDSIEHGIYLTEEICVEMRKRGTYLVPTLVAPLWVVRRGEADPTSVPAWAVEKGRAVMADHQASFRLAVELGVTVAMGTDSGVGPHGTNAEELERMVLGGMSAMQAIVASTSVAARCCQLDHLTGTIAVGMRADILAINGDPLADIGVLQDSGNIHLIMKDGHVFKPLH